MRYPFVNRTSLRLCRTRFCSLRPLPRPPPRNECYGSKPSSAVPLFSTSSSLRRSVKDLPKKFVKQQRCEPTEKQEAPTPAKKQKARKPVKPKRPRTVSAKYGRIDNSGESELEFSEENLRASRTVQLLTRQELSMLPGGHNGSPEAILRATILAIVEDLGGETSIQQSRQTLPSQGNGFFRTVITIAFPADSTLIATGDSFVPDESKLVATLHALAQLRARGLLTLSGLPVKKAFPYEKNVLLEAYNYAARYRCIPRVSVRKLKAFRSIVIDMPEHDIHVAIINAPSMGLAEAAAAHDFKRQAELYHLIKGYDNLDVRNRHALSIHNAKDFFTFCRDSGEPWGGIRVVTKKHGDLHVGKAQVKDLVLGNEIELEVTTRGKSHARQAATLVAALSVIKMKPHLFDGFSEALRAGHGKYLEKLGPKDAVLDPKVIEELDLIQALEWPHRPDPSCSQVVQPHVHDDISSEPRIKRVLTPEQLAMKSSQLQKKMDDYRTRRDLADLRQARSELPMAQYASRVRQIVQDNVYSIIIGATGSGKTTQVPQILLDEAIENGDGASCNVICTQPRRIAATSVARRVAVERAENLRDTVGYHVRAEARHPNPGGSIIYCTTGILLQRFLHDPEDVFDHVSHLVIDEVHDRDIMLDFLLITLKNIMAARAAQGKKLPRVVFMSATIEPEQFAAYFRDSLPTEEPNDCPTLTVPGRTFPVQEYYLDDVLRRMESKHGNNNLGLLRTDEDTIHYLRAENTGNGGTIPNAGTSTESVIDWKDEAAVSGDEKSVDVDNVDDALVPLGLAATTVAHITKTSKSGAILVFLPGLKEIRKMEELLRVKSPLGVSFDDARRFQIIMLHSSIPDSQRSVFDRVPAGCRKVILSTNIAETSVTIPDVRFVVDSGKSREKHYDQTRRITQLQTKWISKSNAKQRAGRAGRVQDGVYCALYTRARRESMRDVALPELLRSDLQEICLDIKVQASKMPVADFLAGAIEPPSPSAVEIAIQNLIALGAITDEEDLTSLGRVLASLPVHPTLGKMILLGIIFRCLDPMIILGAAAHDRPFFASRLDQMQAVHGVKWAFAMKSGSDHIMLVNAFSEARRQSAQPSPETGEFFRSNFISRVAFKSIDLTAREIVSILTEAGLIESQTAEPSLQYGGRSLNENSGSPRLIKALLISGLYPNLAVHTGDNFFRTSAEKGTQIHPGSVNRQGSQKSRLIAFNDLSLSSNGKAMFMRETSSVTPLMALLFGGPLVQDDSVLEMDGWLPMSIRAPDTPGFSFGDSLLADRVLFLRRLLDRMLASAFDDLASHAHAPLAEDPMRRQLALRLARVLDLDTGKSGQNPNPGRQKTRRQKEKDDAPTENPNLNRRQAKRLSKAERDSLKMTLRRLGSGKQASRSKTPRSKTPRSKTPQSKTPQSKTPQSKTPQSKTLQSKTLSHLDTWDRLRYNEGE